MFAIKPGNLAIKVEFYLLDQFTKPSIATQEIPHFKK
jgi:hypothetical protein